MQTIQAKVSGQSGLFSPYFKITVTIELDAIS